MLSIQIFRIKLAIEKLQQNLLENHALECHCCFGYNTQIVNQIWISFFVLLYFQGKLSYIVNNAKCKWSQVFKTLQQFLKTFTDIVYDISVLETSLEDIFLQIARKSLPETEITISSI